MKKQFLILFAFISVLALSQVPQRFNKVIVTGDITSPKFIKTGSNADSVLLGNGSARAISTIKTDTVSLSNRINAKATGNGTANGTNTGDETLTSIKTKLGAATAVSDGYLRYQDFNLFSEKQNALTGSEFIKASPSIPQSAHINLLLPTAPSGTDTRGVEYLFNQNGIVRLGGSDNVPQDDERNYGALLPSTNWWGNSANLGVYSFAAGRNSAAYAPYSVGFGHDNVIYGTASMAGGAGSISGDPTTLTGVDANSNAYCSIVWGKNLLGKGAKSASFGEEGGSGSRSNFTAGYYAITNTSTAGIGTSAIGYNVYAGGDGGVAYGQYLNATNKAKLFGSGINDGNAMLLDRHAIGLGVKTKYPTIILEEADGTTNGRSNVGIGLYGAAASSLLEVGGNTNITGGDIEPATGSKGLYLSFNGNTSYLNSILPSTSWQNLSLNANQIDFGTNSQPKRMSIYTNGNISIGYSSDQNYKLAVNGSSLFNGAIYGNSSLSAVDMITSYSNTTNPSVVIASGTSGSFPVLQLNDGRSGGLSWNIEGGRTTQGNLEFFIGGTKVAFSPSGIITASGFKIASGTSSQYLMADGSTSTGSSFVDQTQTTANGSTSGSMVCSMPFQTGAYKKVMIRFSSLSGNASYSYPTVFTTQPSISSIYQQVGTPGTYTTGGAGASAFTITGASGLSGWILLEGY